MDMIQSDNRRRWRMVELADKVTPTMLLLEVDLAHKI